ncbi:hypothetical protein H2198_002332 [Neophaeococcomyces mojaviensis]|uniref:Uncharacterized protein n=1 Tax=Neophaeococcomyces mojaviensis TaxID=3383035 RepID=A0ACC3AEP6_9EURO|nr:hypothetical protein H2198_002332 [Knufia sp. JES_112]
MKGIDVSAPSFEHHHDGLGVSTSQPRISWHFSHLDNSIKGWQQDSYELGISFADSDQTHTFTVKSSQSICVPWPARALKSRERTKVRVRSYGSSQSSDAQQSEPEPTEWSPWSVVEVGLLKRTDWTAQMIAAPKQLKNKDGSLTPIRLAKTFTLPANRNVVRARIYMTAHGCYDTRINGHTVGDHGMAPGWQSYEHRLHYQIFDVSEHLISGSQNTIDVQIGPGWYASALAWAGGRRCFFGDTLSLLAQLEVEFDDNDHLFVLNTDSSWSSLSSAITSSEIYNGETYEMALERDASKLIPQSSAHSSARIIGFPTSNLASPDTPPVRVTQEIQPVSIFRSKSGKVLVDFGQNLVGRLRIVKLQKAAGTTVSFSHAEVLEDGELGTRPLRFAKNTDRIICDGSELENWTPKFTFHGFRYVEVDTWTPEDKDCPFTVDSIVAQVMHTDMQRTGWFECSHSLVNKLHQNAIWSMRGNFLSVPTDCPQRDERLGWTGDIQVFAPSASFLYDTTGMLGNWLDDLAAEQLSPKNNGVPPFVVPDVITKSHAEDNNYWPAIPNAVWDDVAVLLPWSLYRASGDLNMLRKQYDSMKAWIDRGIRRGADGLWDPELYQLGDWLDPIAPPSEPGNGRTDGVLVADVYLVQVTKKLAEACELLDIAEEAAKYNADATRLLGLFREKYITKSGLIAADTQTALALGIMFGLFEPHQLQAAGDRLARSVRMQQFRVATGFAGTPIVLHALTAVGHSQIAYRMLLEQRCPSWMYAVLMGGTTIWERWDSMLSDGSINPGEMTSFNHYALGSVVNWLHETVGGISSLEPGWRRILVRPIPGGNLTHSKVTHVGPYGRIECAWQLTEGGLFKMTLEVPPNSEAVVVLPSQQFKEKDVHKSEGLQVGSGQHEFECHLAEPAWPPQAIMPPFWPQPQPVFG